MLESFSADANASISHRNAKACAILTASESDFPCVSEFGGIAEQVEDDLTNFVLVRVDRGEGFIHLFLRVHARFQQGLGCIGT